MRSMKISESCWLVSLVLCLAVFVSPALSQEQQCSTSRSGVPACNFNSHTNPFCGWKEKNNGKAWVSTSDTTPVQAYEGNYIYLDHAKSKGQQTLLEAQISSKVTAICVKFYYATNGPVTDPIRFYLSENDQYQVMHELYPNPYDSNIYLNWHSSNFSCCLPNVESGTKKIALSALSKRGSNVAIDFIDIRRSEMVCKGDKLVCYPTPELPPTVTSPPKQIIPRPQQRATPPKPQSSDDSNTYSAAAIGGGIAAAVVVVALIGGGFYWKARQTSSSSPGGLTVEAVYTKSKASNGQSKEEPIGFDNVVYDP